jgi:XTP/dITP diphosphohydrolase
VNGRVFADDSGISVDALGGAPGIYSARYAGLEASDAANNRKLLDELHRVEAQTRDSHLRDAHYICVIALAAQGRIVTVAEGRADGIIINTPRGTGGFGYDPYFYYPPLGNTFAELTPEEKFSVSHRGKAFRVLLKYVTGRGSDS